MSSILPGSTIHQSESDDAAKEVIDSMSKRGSDAGASHGESLGMAGDKKNSRAQAEDRFDKARRTNEAAKSIIDLEHDATRKKTQRLRKLRLAKEAEATAAAEATPVGKRAKPKRKAPTS